MMQHPQTDSAGNVHLTHDCLHGKISRAGLNRRATGTFLHCMLINYIQGIPDSIGMVNDKLSNCINLNRHCKLGIFLLAAAAMFVAAPAQAQTSGKDLPSGTERSMAITIDQMQNAVEKLRTVRDGMVVHFVLPKGWDLVEQGIDPKTGEPIKSVGIYALLARRPMPGNTPTDFIFEMDIYERRLMEDLPPDLPEEEKAEDYQFMNFLNAQIAINARAGMKMTSEIRDIQPKEYRKGSYWVPIYYESQTTGAKLITFATAVDRKLVMLKFLISKDALDLHSGLVAFIINNSWVISEEDLKKMEQEAIQ
jgi:hypothetical protein